MTDRQHAAVNVLAPAVAVRNLGCKVNRVESDSLAASLLALGIPLVPEAEAAVVVVNTCTVTGEASAKTRKAVRQALAAPRGPLVIVTGCAAAIDGESLEALSLRVALVPGKDELLRSVLDALGSLGWSGEVDGGSSRSGTPCRSAVRAGDAFRSRAAIKIQDGCDRSCAYCIVPKARGRSRSVPLDDIRAEAEALVRSGISEIVLTGINIGCYASGSDTLASVVRAVAASGVSRLRLSSIEPQDLGDELLDTLASVRGACPHLHVPLQSGADGVLAAMGRGYDTARFAARIEAARSALGPVAVTTDIIAGFPGESRADAEETVSFVREVGFSRLHVFRYSPRPATAAASMTPQVTAEEKTERARALRDVDVELRAAYACSRLGGLACVLVEQTDDRGHVVGTSEDYLRVRFPAENVDPGTLVDVRLAELSGDEVIARPLSSC